MGDSVTLRLGLPQEGDTIRVALGVVRWVQGAPFGVEFIEMDQKERLRYNATVDNFLQQQATSHSHSRPDQKNYSPNRAECTGISMNTGCR